MTVPRASTEGVPSESTTIGRPRSVWRLVGVRARVVGLERARLLTSAKIVALTVGAVVGALGMSRGFGLACAAMLVCGPSLAIFSSGKFVRVAALYLTHLAAFAAFVLLRDFADETGTHVVVGLPIVLDRAIGLGTIVTVRLQSALTDPGVFRWYDYLAASGYATHFVAIWVVAALLYRADAKSFGPYMIGSALMYLIALPIHFLFPTAPPWLASQWGALPQITRVFTSLGGQINNQLMSEGMRVSGNDVAALPSLHAGVATIILLASWNGGIRWRTVSFLYFSWTSWSIIYGGEHYLIDVVAGAAVAGIGWMVACRLDARVNFPRF